MVDLQRYTKLQIDLVDMQRSHRDLNETTKSKEETSVKKFQGIIIIIIIIKTFINESAY